MTWKSSKTKVWKGKEQTQRKTRKTCTFATSFRSNFAIIWKIIRLSIHFRHCNFFRRTIYWSSTYWFIITCSKTVVLPENDNFLVDCCAVHTSDVYGSLQLPELWLHPIIRPGIRSFRSMLFRASSLILECLLASEKWSQDGRPMEGNFELQFQSPTRPCTSVLVSPATISIFGKFSLLKIHTKHVFKRWKWV